MILISYSNISFVKKSKIYDLFILKRIDKTVLIKIDNLV